VVTFYYIVNTLLHIYKLQLRSCSPTK